MVMVCYRFLGLLLSITYLIAIYPGIRTEHSCQCFKRKSVCRYCSIGHENLSEGDPIPHCRCCNHVANKNEPSISGVCTCGDMDKDKATFSTEALNPLRMETWFMKISKVFYANCGAVIKGYEDPPIRPPIKSSIFSLIP